MPVALPLKVSQLSSSAGELREFGAGDYLSLAQGGTGVAAASLAELRAALGLKSAAVADILGPVSSAGALMQYGSTANGEFWRFASGLQICAHLVIQPARTFAPNDVVGHSGWIFPAAFASRPRVFSGLEGLSSYLFGCGHEIVGSTQVTNFFYRYNGTVNLDSRVMNINWLAVGGW